MKVSSDFGSEAFSPMLVDICWIYTKGHRGMFFFISLGSLVLFKDSKTRFKIGGGDVLELFQCSAEGCHALLNETRSFPLKGAWWLCLGA